MTPKELEQARVTLGNMWRLGGPLSAADLGRLLEFDVRDPGARVRVWETGGTDSVPGPVSAFVKALLAGYVPPQAPRAQALRQASVDLFAPGQAAVPVAVCRSLTLSEAKEGLGLSFGVPPEAIEITIRG